MKLCKDCKFCLGISGIKPLCKRTREINSVTGIASYFSCKEERSLPYYIAVITGICGKSARHFEPKQ